ncbi:hypothetical protein GGR56DRAFT_172906 [Xylariaceae sp. FL0804]|nr:hypothetical protein GGR56DRAFT_172906 [Xylariaceae sp. FL0804]
MAFEQTRDLRSGAQDSKRNKEHREKWSRGSRPSAGCKSSWEEPDIVFTGSESQREKMRPERFARRTRLPPQNVVKPRGSQPRAKIDALTEVQDPSNISRSLHDLMPSPRRTRKLSVGDNFLYSFDRQDTPGKPLSLDIFIKANPKETEKLVEQEYTVLDGNGDALTGRKARHNLRRQNHASTTSEPEIVEDDGFELI